MIDTKNLTAVQTVDGSTQVLGHMFWFSVGKQLVNATALKDALLNSGLDESWMPNEIRSVDAFRRATKEIEAKKPTSTANVFENYLVREVFADNKQVQRNIVVETVDQSGKRLDYNSNAAVVTLDKINNQISFVVEQDNDFAQTLCDDAQNKFNIYKDHYSAQQVRVMVSKIMNALSPTPLRPNGGIYFIPESQTEGLTKLVNFIAQLDNSEGFKVPVVNTFDNQKMVNQKLHDYLDGIINDCQRGTNEPLKKGQIKEIINNAKTVIEDYKNYQSIIESEKDGFEDKIIQIRAGINKLLTDME